MLAQCPRDGRRETARAGVAPYADPPIDEPAGRRCGQLDQGRPPSSSAETAVRPLGVLSNLVGYAADGWAADGGVVSVMVVGVDPVGKCVGAVGV